MPRLNQTTIWFNPRKENIRLKVWDIWKQTTAQNQLKAQQRYWTLLGWSKNQQGQIINAELKNLLDTGMAKAQQVITCQSISHPNGNKIHERNTMLAANHPGMQALRGNITNLIHQIAGDPKWWPAFVHFDTLYSLNHQLDETTNLLKQLSQHYTQTGQTCFLAANFQILRRYEPKKHRNIPNKSTQARISQQQEKEITRLVNQGFIRRDINKTIHLLPTRICYKSQSDHSIMGYCFFRIGPEEQHSKKKPQFPIADQHQPN